MNDKNLAHQKKVIKEIILDLHQGISLEKAKERLEQEVGSISSLEIAEVEQSLINEGMSTDEIKKFCNVHALLFESSLQEDLEKTENPAHPISLFKAENREIEEITQDISKLTEQADTVEVDHFTGKISALLDRLKDIELHYTRKEQLLFPYLERYGFMGPSKVMWGKDNEIRDLYKQARLEIDRINNRSSMIKFIDEKLNPLLEEIKGMIFKEENILFPTSLEKLQKEDWISILQESSEIGYAYIELPAETAHLIKALQETAEEEPAIREGLLNLPSGTLTPEQLMHSLNALPVDLTFVDQDGIVRYFSENTDRIFVRTRAIIGRHVENCHPPQSLEQVQKILSSFKDGSRDSAEFWINLQGKMIFIVFLAIRDSNSRYLGTLEIAQDITRLQKLKGERRLLDEGN